MIDYDSINFKPEHYMRLYETSLKQDRTSAAVEFVEVKTNHKVNLLSTLFIENFPDTKIVKSEGYPHTF